MADIAILGSGGWGTAIGIMLSRHNHNVTLWSAFKEEVDTLNKDREHKKLLEGVKIPDSVKITTDKNCVYGKDIIVLAVPSSVTREIAHWLKDYIKENQIIVNIAKGLDEKKKERLSQAVRDEIPDCRFAVISGPSHAEEVAREVPTASVVSAFDEKTAEYVQEVFMNETYRLYINSDMAGVELGGALKNVIALAAGVCDGMGYGDNSKAALMTRGITEIARLGVCLGGKKETFAGLSGIGDLIVTCTSINSRNYRCGVLIGKGVPIEEAVKKVNMTVEGYKTAKTAYNLAKECDVDMPIINEIYNVLYCGKDREKAICDLMIRPKKAESENIWINN